MHSNPTKHIVITGASGCIGLALVRFFSENGNQVTALVRQLPSKKTAGVAYRLYNLESDPNLEFLTSDCIVIHCAYAKNEKKIQNEEVNEWAAKKLLAAAEKAGVRKCIFMSSISVTTNSDSYYSRQKSKIEALFSAPDNLIVRPSLVIGHGGLFYKTVSKLKKTKVLPLIHGGNQPIYYVGIADLVAAVAVAVKEDISGIQVVSNPTPIPYKAFYQAAARQLVFKVVGVPIPLSVLKFGVFLQSFLPNPTLTTDNLKGLVATPKLDINTHPDFKFQPLEAILNDFKW